MKTKLISLMCAILMLSCLFAGCSADIRTAGDPTTQSTTDQGTLDQGTPDGDSKEPSVASAYVSLDINPEISLTVDENNLITGIFAENEDAQILLYGEEDFTGMDYESAVEKITFLAVELGYLDEENKVIGVMVSSENEEKVTEIKDKIEEKVKKIAEEKEIEITTSDEGAYSLICDLEELKEKYPDNEKIQKLTKEKFRLAKTAYESGEMTVEEAVELEEKELISRLDNAFKRIDKFATKSYDEARKNAEIVYESAVNSLLDALYSEFYMSNIENYSSTYYYGALYQLYTSSYRSYILLAEKLLEESDVVNEELTEEQKVEIAKALGIENMEELANENGEITLDSVENFVDKYVKNSKDRGELDRVKGQLKDRFERIEKEISERVEKEKLEKPLEEGKHNFSEQILNAIEHISRMLPQEAKAELDSYVNEYKQITSCALDGLTKEEASLIAENLKLKAEELLDKIARAIGEENVKAIEEQKAKIEDGLTKEKAECEASIENAKNEARGYLENAKKERREKTKNN